MYQITTTSPNCSANCSSSTAKLTSSIEDEIPNLAGKEDLFEHITSEERDRIEKEARTSTQEVDWLRFLASKVIWETKLMIGENRF